MVRQLLTIGFFLSAYPPTRLSAQCPDGSPPPCRGAVRRTPPLDERTWIVLPFDNVTRAADAEWMRDASANLLYLDLARWQDVRVIDDERVADLLRGAPQSPGRGLGLDAALALARRVGAGKLVMGDLLKSGNRTTVTAKVFDVRSGQRLRSVSDVVLAADSVIGTFGRVARGVLGVTARPGETGNAIGTTSLAAYRAYLEGVRSLNAWELDSAEARFTRALASDSSFALAHFQLAMVYGWNAPDQRQRVLEQAEAANRLGSSLPARERRLIAAVFAMAEERYADACTQSGTQLRADSNDVDAWYQYGECNFHDHMLEPVPGDTTKLMFRSSWNAALHAFERALELDPTYHLAYAHIPDILQAEQRPGCRAPHLSRDCGLQIAVPTAVADTLVTIPVVLTDREALRSAFRARIASQGALRVRARDLSARWVTAGPAEQRARLAYARALLANGQADDAAAQLGIVRLGRLGPEEVVLATTTLVETAVKRGNAPDAARWLDSAEAVLRTTPRGIALLPTFAWHRAILGQFDRGWRMLADTSSVARYARAAWRLGAGLRPDSLRHVDSVYRESMLSQVPPAMRGQYVALLGASLRVFAFGAGEQPPMDRAGPGDWRGAVIVAAQSGDTARLRGALTSFDSLLGQLGPELGGADFQGMIAVGYLLLGDSAAALERLHRFDDRLRFTPLNGIVVGEGTIFGGHLWGRFSLLEGDVAAARGDQDYARRGYRRVVALWSHGDPELEPLVARARAALAQLGAN